MFLQKQQDNIQAIQINKLLENKRSQNSPNNQEYTSSTSVQISNYINQQFSPTTSLITIMNPSHQIPTSTLRKVKLYSRQNSVGTSERNIANLSNLSSETISKNSSNRPRFFQLQNNKTVTQAAKKFVERSNAIISHKRTQSQNKEIKLSSIASPKTRLNQYNLAQSLRQFQGEGDANQDYSIQTSKQQLQTKERLQPSIHQDVKNNESKFFENQHIHKNQSQNLINQYNYYYGGGGQLYDYSRWNLIQYNQVQNSNNNDNSNRKNNSPQNVAFLNKNFSSSGSLLDKIGQNNNINNQNNSQNKINFLSTASILNQSNNIKQPQSNLALSIEQFRCSTSKLSKESNHNSSNLPQSIPFSCFSNKNEVTFSQNFSSSFYPQTQKAQSGNISFLQAIKVSDRQQQRVSKNIRFKKTNTPVATQQYSNWSQIDDNQFRQIIKQKLDKQNYSKERFQAQMEQTNINDQTKQDLKIDIQQIDQTENIQISEIDTDERQSIRFKTESFDSTKFTPRIKQQSIQQSIQQNNLKLILKQRSSDNKFKADSSSIGSQLSKSQSLQDNNQIRVRKVTIQENDKNRVKNSEYSKQNSKTLQKQNSIANQTNDSKDKKYNIMITPQQIQQIMDSEKMKRKMEKQKVIYDLVKQVEENPLDNLHSQKKKQNLAYKDEINKKDFLKNSILMDLIKSKNKQSVAVIQDILRNNNASEVSAQIESLVQQQLREEIQPNQPHHTFQKYNTLTQFSNSIQNAKNRNSFRQMQYQDFIKETNLSNLSYYNDSLSPRDKNSQQIQAINENRFINQITKDQIVQKKNGKILRKQLKEALHYIFKLKISPKEVYMTALHWACKRGHYQVVQLLIQFGADVDAKDLIGRTPLYFAIANHDKEIAKLLLLNQADPWSTSEYNLSELIKDDAKMISLLSRFRKLNIVTKMCQSNQREEFWKKQSTFLDNSHS